MFKKYRFLFIWLAFDILMVILHLTLSGTTGFFDLDKEQNLPTVYQSFKLLFAGNIVFFILWLERNVLKIKEKARTWFLGILGTLFLYIGLDELGQLHENVEFYVAEVSPEFAAFVLGTTESWGYQSSVWLLYYAPFIILSLPFLAYLIYYSFKVYGKRTYLLVVMMALFFAVIYLEFISTTGQYWGWEYDKLMILEEFAEKLGATLGAYYVWLIFRDIQPGLLKKYG